MNKSLAEWLSHFENLHPVGIDMGLTRVATVWQQLCQTYNIGKLAKQKVISVAGTNGKGSACKMLSLLLSASGARVGMYTSPHLHHFREQVQINGLATDDALLVRAFAAIERARGTISITYFEATTLAGLLCFAWKDVDYAVLEVGLGGRLDAINIIDADAAIITSIGLDHQAFLGCDLSQIVLEKAGICRTNAPCVYADATLYDTLVDFAENNDIPLIARGRDYHIRGNCLVFQSIEWPIPDVITALGKHQIANCAGVLALLSQLALLPDSYADSLAHFALPGRLEQIATSPDIVVDVAHNEDAAIALAAYLRKQAAHYDRIHAIIGMLADKDHRAVLSAVKDCVDTVTVTSTFGDRGFSGKKLAQIAQTLFDCDVNQAASPNAALAQVKAAAKTNDLIIAFGSFMVVSALT